MSLILSPAPHVRTKNTTQRLMLNVVISLLPCAAAGIYYFGLRAAIVLAVSVVSAVLAELVWQKLAHQTVRINDFSAVVTGLLLGLCITPSAPWWMVMIGAFFAIIVVKQLFGGLGTNFLNPALGGRAFLMLCYPVPMTTWAAPGKDNWVSIISSAKTLSGVDVVTGATPLANDFMKKGLLPDGVSLSDMFIGNIGGCVGEISAIALLIGGIYMLAKGVIRIRIPAAYIITVAVLTLVFSRAPEDVNRVTWMLYEIFGGGLFLGAFFMATDYVTSPNTPKGEVIFGIGAGLLVVFIRRFGGYPEGVCYSILIMNICVWLIDKATLPHRFGVSAEMRKAEKEKAKAAKKAAKEGA